jgi:hypothetical protein
VALTGIGILSYLISKWFWYNQIWKSVDK